ncbi:MAG: glycosyltransferase [Pseudomonadota bacterium]
MAASENALESAFDLTFIVPGDPDQNTGGYRYVGRLVRALNALGSRARVMGVEGRFPFPDDIARASLDAALAQLPENSVVILDGLAMGGLPDIVERHGHRLVLVALVHHPLADETGLGDNRKAWFLLSEKQALANVRGVVATSDYTAARLADFGVVPSRVRVARPGVDVMSENRFGTTAAEATRVELLCVAHLSPRKAQIHLVEALAELRQLPWHCTLVGSDQRDADYGAAVKQTIARHHLEDRVTVAGELDGHAVDEAYRTADLFVFPSLYEGYGMAIDEALAAGLPVITSDGGALARVADMPGIRHYPAGDIRALGDILAKLMAKPRRLASLKHEVMAAQSMVQSWTQTAEAFMSALADLTGEGDATTFDAGWLALREPADHRARSRDLTGKLATWMEERYRSGAEPGPLAIADLGCGGGSNARYMVPVIAVPQHWTLLDQDAELLNIAGQRLASLDIPVEAVAADLSAATLAEQIPRSVSVITASALIDLVSAPWLDALADCARGRRAAVFVVLSYNGCFRLTPTVPDDDLILRLVNEHQHGHKGAGAALGPDASGVLSLLLASRGYQVTTAASPWELGPDDAELQLALLQGWCQAATEQRPGAAEQISRWLEQRQRQARAGELTIQVGHEDLLALPPEGRRG